MDRKKLLIALDYDNTLTADPQGFKAIIRCFQSLGHEVMIVTMRCKEKDYEPQFDELRDKYQVDAIFCDGNPKRKFTETLGYKFDIWIDDYPEGIHLGSQYSPDQLDEWREEQQLKTA